MDERQFERISNKIDIIIKLLVLKSVEGKELKHQVSMLASFGFQPKQIADMLGRKPSHVRVILHRLREEAAQTEEETDNDENKQREDGNNA